MTSTPAPTQYDVYVALGDFLSAVTTAEVIRGQINRVPMPAGPNWIVMQAVRRGQMSTTVRDYVPTDGVQTMDLSTALYFQLDAYGPASAENAQAIVTTFRSLWGTERFKALGLVPLYCEEPAQMPLVAGEQQWIERWMIQCALHGNIELSVDQQFADTLITGLTEITHGI
jgi:hypothetical protein